MVVVEARVVDSTHLEPAHPIDTAPGGRVVVSVADAVHNEDDADDWTGLSLQGLALSYGESEPDYCAGMVREPNPEL